VLELRIFFDLDVGQNRRGKGNSVSTPSFITMAYLISEWWPQSGQNSFVESNVSARQPEHLNSQRLT
jgi:hypothetical protein